MRSVIAEWLLKGSFERREKRIKKKKKPITDHRFGHKVPIRSYLTRPSIYEDEVNI